MKPQDRRRLYKTLPIAEKETNQHARREKALEEQKRKRALRVESSRNIDAFANLSLGHEDDLEEEPEILREGVAHLVSFLPSENNGTLPGRLSRKDRKANARFANKIMYAELLEMKDDPSYEPSNHDDGLPPDLETAWVALAPVPQGKRCLAVSNQSTNVPGTVTNTFLKSRLKGRTILTFPSPLPPRTILDCILDENWKTNGILHVLDVVQWKGQEVGECEANFRFWWRDTRLAELVSIPPLLYTEHEPQSSVAINSSQIFTYPTLFIPVPYHLDLSAHSLLSSVIPLCRSSRSIPIILPSGSDSTEQEEHMDLDQQPSRTGVAEIYSDGLLLYVSQASYEPGTSPLSSWIPHKALVEGQRSPLANFERLVSRRKTPPSTSDEVAMES